MAPFSQESNRAHFEWSFSTERCNSQGEDFQHSHSNRVCLGVFTLHAPASVLSGVICLHFDDMLGTGDDLFESKLKELDELVGFGSMRRQKFDHCGRQYEGHANGEKHDFHQGMYSEREEGQCDS